MHFLLIARDGADASGRRSKLREEHLALANQLRTQGKLLYGVAMLDDAGQPVGSMEVLQFESRAQLDDWLQREPFVTGKVWDRVEVVPCRVGPMFSGR